ncbi:hypothetical protein QLG12_04200 [Pseudomonas sp. V88_4]|uniref:hypothetical protein n=1 Tax=Pseudomonas sp. V88_4 TaxID=3044229 RepID=UPI00249F2915|nr:hypothetical protein [Pseudomonas sp. V88_4]MDI3397404.1 hypothetical protein [Pseudomonas sp. V88_4]
MQLAQGTSLLDIDDATFDFGNVASRRKLDQTEKSSIASSLSTLAGKRPDIELIDLRDTTVPRLSGTTFDNALEFARVALSKMLETEDFAFLAQKHSLPDDTVVCIDEQARLRVLIKDGWVDITNDSAISTDLLNDILMLGDCAEKTGGCVFSGEFFAVEQWLRFHEYTLPGNVEQVRNLVEFLQFEIPQSPDTADFYQLLGEPVDSPFHLSAEARKTITLVTDELTQGQSSLLKFIATEDLRQVPEVGRRERAADYLERFLDSPKARMLGEVLHQRLQWHLEQADREVAKRQIKCLAATALILDLKVDVERHAKTIAGFALYQPDNALRTPSQVVQAFEKQLIVETQLEPELGPLAAHLLLAGAAPQFLVQQMPVELTIGKPGWVILSQAVALIELAAPGASRLMTYARVKAFSELAPVSTAQRAMHELATITPVIQWAMLNGVLPATTDNEYDVDAFIIAANRFSEYAEALNEVETGISVVPPERRELALQALKRVLPAGDYLEQRVFKARFDPSLGERNILEWLLLYHPVSLSNANGEHSKIERLRVSILDLYLSGDLVVDGKLTDKFITTETFNPPANAFSRFGELEPIDSLFDEVFEQYHQTLQKSLQSIIKMAVSNLPKRDRTMLANGFITLYTVRKSVNTLNPFEETQRHRNAAKGRYGIILGCQNGKAFHCYELFSLRGLCRERPELADMLRSTGVVYEEPSLSYKGADTDFQPKKPERQWPLDLDAYLNGSEPKHGVKSGAVVEKLWHFTLTSEEVHPVPLFFSAAFQSLAQGILGNHPVATRDELYSSLYAKTELQQIRAENDQVNEAIINVIVPFKKCVEDLRSGDASQVTEGIGGCILDGLALLGLVVGFGATIVGIAGKTTSTTAKALSIAKAGAHFSVSIFNPLDGLPTLAVQGGRLAKKGVLLLSKYGLNTLETATGQLRKLTGSAQSYDLVKAAQKSDLFQGTWKAANNPGDAVSLLALQRNNDWYALNHRVGGAWGPKLRNLKVSPLAPLRRLFGRSKPFSYTRAYVKRALPTAKSKLDNAVLMLLENDNADMRAVLKHVFGNDSDEVLRHVKANLHNMRNDLDYVTLANMSFKKGSEANAALRPPVYRRWKASVLDGSYLKNPPERFLVIYPDGLDDYYRIAKYDDGRIGDVLVHEMAHGAPDTLDLYYGQLKQAGAGPADMDVAGLLDFAKDAHKAHPKNLSNPHFRATHDEGFELLGLIENKLPSLVKKHPALLNADSYSLAVSMLDQARTHRETFLLNLARIQNGLKNTNRLGFIDGSVRLKLSKAPT